MRKCIILLLIIGTVWAQTDYDLRGWISKDIPSDFDKLILKNGVEHNGEYLKTDQKVIYFKPLDTFAFQPVPLNIIKVLKLKDGTILYNSEKNIMYAEKKLLLKTIGIALIGLYLYSLYFNFSLDDDFSFGP